MNLSQYVKKKNGVPFGHPNSLRNNLKRSLGAKNFSAFWNYWNPIFGFYLGTKVFKPLKRVFSNGVSVVITFIVCGFIHDLVTMLISQKLTLFFTLWFLIMGTAVAVTKRINYDLSRYAWWLRAFVNLVIISLCLLLTIFINKTYS
jgi:prepilin signal peptidase PulO-like enzyme (type II secretory pathway)